CLCGENGLGRVTTETPRSYTEKYSKRARYPADRSRCAAAAGATLRPSAESNRTARTCILLLGWPGSTASTSQWRKSTGPDRVLRQSGRFHRYKNNRVEYSSSVASDN